ncbi:hypothetical protein C6A85_000000100945 [Mycobacterium sp. ITM-2017-0098]|nr:hypothetical protein C6A85_000000100945 [Mycobacterium sp. ITM-2017-0098]
MIVIMSEPTTTPSEQSEAATDPVSTSPPTATEPAVEPRTVYVQQPASRLNKAAAWVGIAAGSVFIIAVIFGAGVFVGKNINDGPRRHHQGHEMVVRPGPGMFPPGPPGGFERGPGFPNSPRPNGPMMQPSGEPAGPSAPATSAPPRP